MNIGTDKISQKILDTIPHHSINIVNPNEVYTAGQWKIDTVNTINDIHIR